MPNISPAETVPNMWVNRKEAADYLGLSAQTLANNRATGPKFAKFFGAVRYHLDDLESWARQRMKAA